MIIAPEENQEKGSMGMSDSNAATSSVSEGPPPSYDGHLSTTSGPSVTSDSSASASTTSEATEVLSPPLPKTTNHLVLIRPHSQIKGIYAIDPFMSIPASLLPPLAEGETVESRKNLKLQCNHGTIDADIHIVGRAPPTESAKRRKRALVALSSEHGTVKARLHHSSEETIIPFVLDVSCPHGSANISLPRSFSGPISIAAKMGSVTFSQDLQEHMTAFSEVDSVRKLFVGDFSMYEDGENGWSLDQLSISCVHGRVKLQYTDELGQQSSGSSSRKSFFGRWFGS